ncbi:Hypothetical predicted protein, partial [Pelobates cultripes]
LMVSQSSVTVKVTWCDCHLDFSRGLSFLAEECNLTDCIGYRAFVVAIEKVNSV